MTCLACGRESPAGFVFCGFCGASLPAEPAAPPVRERRVVSVLFCDVVGFTAASDGADPEDVQARMQAYYGRLRPVVERFGGLVEKLLGDGVMAVFGVPVAHEDDAERAVRAGLAIVEAVRELGVDAVGSGLAVRVGVNTGEVLVDLGAHQAGEGELLGDVVNLAARIQSAAPVNGVVVGEATFRATSRVFEYERLESVQVKGKAGLVELWRAVGVRARLGSDVVRSLATPLVGRERDLGLLRAAFDGVVAGRRVRLVTVLGEPGVGKSRLVAELNGYVDGLPLLVRWRQGRCPPYGTGITFWALGEIVKAQAGIYDSDAADVATAKLDAVLDAGGEREWLRARLLSLLGIATGEQAAAQPELFAAWRRFFESIAGQAPLVLVVEDIHWADPALLDFLEHLAASARDVPLLVLCTARPELFDRRPGWAAGLADHTAIPLAPLSDSDTAMLVAGLLCQALLPAETQRLLLERAGGNPLFAEEFVRMLRDRDLLDERGGLRAGVDGSVPESIQAVIAARLDTLAQAHKRVLQDAAVVGKVFWAGAAAAIGGRGRDGVEQALVELAARQLIRPAEWSSMEDEPEFGFSHALVRDVAYAQIPRAERAVRHLRAAGWLEGKAGERLDDLAEVLAHHTGEALALAEAARDGVLQAEVTPLAARHFLLAGRHAVGLDTARALGLLDRALALTPADDPSFPLVLLRWAEAAETSGRPREAADALRRAAAAFEERGDVVRAGETFGALGYISRRIGDPDWFGNLERAVELLEPSPGAELVAALSELVDGQMLTNAYEPGVATANRALELAEQLGLPVPGWALGGRGVCRCALGDAGGLGDLKRAAELLNATSAGRHSRTVRHNLAVQVAAFEGTAAGIAEFDRAIAAAVERGMAWDFSSAVRISFLIESGRLEEASEAAVALLPSVEQSGDRVTERFLLDVYARALVEQGKAALEPALRSLAIARETESRIAILAGEAAALVAAGDHDTVRELVDRRIARNPGIASTSGISALARAAVATGDRALVARLAGGAGRAIPRVEHSAVVVHALQAELAGDHSAAASLFADAAARWERFTSVLEQAYALLGQGRCLAALGDPAADRPLLEARRLFSQMGARPRVAECDRLLAALAERAS